MTVHVAYGYAARPIMIPLVQVNTSDQGPQKPVDEQAVIPSRPAWIAGLAGKQRLDALPIARPLARIA